MCLAGNSCGPVVVRNGDVSLCGARVRLWNCLVRRLLGGRDFERVVCGRCISTRCVNSCARFPVDAVYLTPGKRPAPFLAPVLRMAKIVRRLSPVTASDRAHLIDHWIRLILPQCCLAIGGQELENIEDHLFRDASEVDSTGHIPPCLDVSFPHSIRKYHAALRRVITAGLLHLVRHRKVRSPRLSSQRETTDNTLF